MATEPGPSPAFPSDPTAGAPATGLALDRRLVDEADAVLRVVHWRDGETRQQHGLDGLRESMADAAARRWIDLSGASPDLVAAVAAALDLHELVAEDIVERNQRPKLELTDHLVHVVTFAVAYDRELLLEEIDLVLGPGFLLTVHDRFWDPRQVEHLREGAGPLLARGVDYLLWAFLDGIVDAYYPAFDRLGDEIDELEDQIVQGPSRATLDHLFALKRQLIDVRHIAAPQREIFNQLTNRTIPLIAPEHVIYFRDVYDHAIHLSDEYDSFRDLVSGSLDVYLSTVNNSLSVIMKRLTGVTVILAGIGALAGLFGMSEAADSIGLSRPVGFWVVTGTILALAVITLWVLRRRDWI
jgi:magnesium transporter